MVGISQRVTLVLTPALKLVIAVAILFGLIFAGPQESLEFSPNFAKRKPHTLCLLTYVLGSRLC